MGLVSFCLVVVHMHYKSRSVCYKIRSTALTARTSGASHLVLSLHTHASFFDLCRGDFGRLGHDDVLDVFIPKQISGLDGKQVALASAAHTPGQQSSMQSAQWTSSRTAESILHHPCHADSNALLHHRLTEACLHGCRSAADELASALQVTQVSCGDTHTCVLTDQGEVYTFGRNQASQTRQAESMHAADAPFASPSASALSSSNSALLRSKPGSALQNGQLGLGTDSDCLSPTLVSTLQVLSPLQPVLMPAHCNGMLCFGSHRLHAAHLCTMSQCL